MPVSLDIRTPKRSLAEVPIALFIPCYVDQVRPEVGMATVELLEHYSIDFTVIDDPSCCGQPLINMGAKREALPLLRRFERVLERFEAIVCPSGSCVASLRHSDLAHDLGSRIFELSEYLVRFGSKTGPPPLFPHRVMVHPSCHGLRELGLGNPSEQPTLRPHVDTVMTLLDKVPGIELLTPERDECCGFGGIFSANEAAVSVRMGQDRLDEYRRANAEVVTSTDISCLMHLESVALTRGAALCFMHFAQILTAGSP